ALWKCDRERSRIRAAIIVAHRPAACSPDRVAGRDSDSADVGKAQERHLLVTDGRGAEEDGPDESAPEDEATPAPQITNVVRDDEHVVHFRTNNRPEKRGE